VRRYSGLQTVSHPKWLEQSGYGRQQRRLAGPVGANNGNDFPFGHVHGNILQNFQFAITRLKVSNPQHCTATLSIPYRIIRAEIQDHGQTDFNCAAGWPHFGDGSK
jgi:hypothetical protein